MTLNEIITEKRAIDFTKNFGKKHKELILPIYTREKFDYGSVSNKVEISDALMKASDTGNIYGRRAIAQRKLKKVRK